MIRAPHDFLVVRKSVEFLGRGLGILLERGVIVVHKWGHAFRAEELDALAPFLDEGLSDADPLVCSLIFHLFEILVSKMRERAFHICSRRNKVGAKRTRLRGKR